MELTALLGDDIIVAPDAQNVLRHTRDYCVEGPADIGIIALAYPRNTAQVAAILRYCNQRRIAVQPQGGMTGLSGGGVPVGPCVVVSLERMRAIREIDIPAGTITVEAGVVMQAVQQAAEDAELFFPLDLGGRGACQIGGNLSTNAGGNRVLRFGMARDLVLGVEAVLADGTIIDALRKVIKNNTGYDVRQLFIGTEGTLGIITAAVLRLFPKPRSVCTGLCAVADYAAVLALLARARAGFASQLTAFEVMWPEFYRGRHRRGGQPGRRWSRGGACTCSSKPWERIRKPILRVTSRSSARHWRPASWRTRSLPSRSANRTNCGACAIRPVSGRRPDTGRN